MGDVPVVLWTSSRPGDLRFDASAVADASLSVPGSNRTAAGKRNSSYPVAWHTASTGE